MCIDLPGHRPYADWLDEIFGWIDISDDEELFCQRCYQLGCTVRSTIDAIRDMREAEDEREQSNAYLAEWHINNVIDMRRGK